MGKFVIIVVIIGAFLLILGSVRRFRPSPCPWWLTCVLDNRYMEFFAGSVPLIRRIGLTSGMRVLDVGCGPGRIAIPVAQYVGTEGEVVAMDIQEKMLQKLEKRAKEHEITNIRTVLAGVGHGMLPERSVFDRVLLVTVLGEIPDKKSALTEIFEALKPGGMLSVTEVFLDPDYQSRRKIRKLIGEAGFEYEHTFGTMYAFTLNCRKPIVSHT
ncbi:MAG: methyltransferase domain-containing protein [Thermodesulfobacteriota bacterium]|nr:methyltransferase domain-containing protein [Thermodesulfobacteriota bacterium]